VGLRREESAGGEGMKREHHELAPRGVRPCAFRLSP
jgi:hypothetical protein